LSYENICDQMGYITERIFDSFYSGCVPVYLGPKDIYNYIPQECFVNVKEFSSYENLYEFMNSMDENSYKSYVLAARNFINSSEGSVFSSKQLSKTVIEHLKKLEKLNG
jgi:Glycosyltransferase family 10 (fucosyltransferase).